MPPKRSAKVLDPDVSIDEAFELFGKSYKRMKASIDEATARDNDNAQLRAELQEAKKREELSHKNSDKWHQMWDHRYHGWGEERGKRVAAERSMMRLEVKNTALRKQLSQMAEREKGALKKLGDLKERLRELGKEA